MPSDHAPVLVLRHPERAVRIAEALDALGLTSFALPLTDTELPADPGAVATALEMLGGGGYRWLVVTSGNTVQALGTVAASRGESLAQIVRSGGARVAAVGSATARSLEDAGIAVDLVPQNASSAGLLREFPPGTGALLLPQADLAPADLWAGLAGLGWSVQRVEAYRTVAYPADPARRVAGLVEQGTPPPLITPEEVAMLATNGVQPAVVFTAPSTVRQFHERLGDGSLAFFPVAIGRATAAALREQGWEPGATATDPTPQGIAQAVDEALARGRAVSRAPAPPLNGEQP